MYTATTCKDFQNARTMDVLYHQNIEGDTAHPVNYLQDRDLMINRCVILRPLPTLDNR